jgi:hypothetical protein
MLGSKIASSYGIKINKSYSAKDVLHVDSVVNDKVTQNYNQHSIVD